MPNVYTNYKANLSTDALTTVYTVGSETSAVIKSVRVSNKDTSNDCKVSLFVVDSDSASYPLETDRKIEKGSSQELLATGKMDHQTADSSVTSATPIILKESEVLKAQAEFGGDLTIVVSVLEIT
jgi:hypothetical protein|tara:strand:+ start:131 stop:505 length:375 start_codon:yes stop_codon:yes gene_type:complete